MELTKCSLPRVYLYCALFFSFFLFIQLRSVLNGFLLATCIAGFLAVGGVILSNSRVVKIKPDSSLFLLVMWCLLSVFWSDYPLYAVQRSLYLVFVVFVAVVVTNSVASNDFYRVLKNFAIFQLIIDLVFVLFFPSIGQMAGLSGLHYEKNQFGTICAISCISLFLLPSRNRVELFFGLLALVLLYFSESKTSFWLVISLLMVFGSIKSNILYVRANKIIYFSAVYALIAIIFFLQDAIYSWLLNAMDDEFMTGRGYIWKFALENINDKYFGNGFGSFWQTGENSFVAEYFKDTDTKWMAEIEQGHSGYIDAYVALGVIGFSLFINWIFSGLYRVVRRGGVGPISFSLLAIIHNFSETSFLYFFSPLFFLYIVYSMYSEDAEREIS